MRRRGIVALATAVLGVVALATGAVASSGTAPSHVAIGTKLANPRQLTFAPDGALVIALAGSGGLHSHPPGQCFNDDAIGQSCVGSTAGIAEVLRPSTATAGSAQRVQTGMMSIGASPRSGDPVGGAAIGLDALSFAPDGTEYGIFTWAAHHYFSNQPHYVQHEDGALVRITPDGIVHVVADIGDYSMSHHYAGHRPQYSDPYGVLALDHQVFVTDAANNTLLRVDSDGHISTVHVFPYRHGDGADGSFDTVPTSIAYDGHHLFVGTLGSLIPGKGKVYELTKSGRVVRTIDGLSQVTSIAVSSTGALYVTEIFGGHGAPTNKSGRPNGMLVKIAPGGHMVSRHVPLPGGVAVRHGFLYVSVNAISPTEGAVWRLKVSDLS